MVAVRQGRFKLISNGDSLDELYDVVADPKEGRNLIDEPGFATIVDGLRRLSPKD
jgi:hypothetical protein